MDKVVSDCGACLVLVRVGMKNSDNPWGFGERVEMIRAAFPDAEKVDILPVPDVDYDLAVYFGRDVGYERILLDEGTESISATDIRRNGVKP